MAIGAVRASGEYRKRPYEMRFTTEKDKEKGREKEQQKRERKSPPISSPLLYFFHSSSAEPSGPKKLPLHNRI